MNALHVLPVWALRAGDRLLEVVSPLGWRLRMDIFNERLRRAEQELEAERSGARERLGL